MLKNLTIREALPRDMNGNLIQNVFNQVRREETANGRKPLGSPCYPEWREFIARQKNGEKRYQFLVVENSEGSIVGFCIARHTLRMTHTTFEKIAILQAYQKSGLGTELLQKVVELARELGKEKIQVKAEFGKGRAYEFYKKYGFILECTTKQVEGGMNTAVMRYDLKG